MYSSIKLSYLILFSAWFNNISLLRVLSQVFGVVKPLNIIFDDSGPRQR